MTGAIPENCTQRLWYSACAIEESRKHRAPGSGYFNRGTAIVPQSLTGGVISRSSPSIPAFHPKYLNPNGKIIFPVFAVNSRPWLHWNQPCQNTQAPVPAISFRTNPLNKTGDGSGRPSTGRATSATQVTRRREKKVLIGKAHNFRCKFAPRTNYMQ